MLVSDQDWAVIYEALRAANTPYTHEEVAYVVTMERKSWDIVQRITDSTSNS